MVVIVVRLCPSVVLDFPQFSNVSLFPWHDVQRAERQVRADVREDLWTLVLTGFRSSILDSEHDDDDMWVKLIPKIVRASEVRLAMDDYGNFSMLYRLLSSLLKEGPYPARFGRCPPLPIDLTHNVLSVSTHRFMGGVTRSR